MNRNYYPWYRLDKNVCWYNINTWWAGLLYGLAALEPIREPREYAKRFRMGPVWLPPQLVESFTEDGE